MERYIEYIGMVAAITMPLWNIPLMLRIAKRKTSNDISLMWVFGVWGSIVAMFPSTLISKDPVMRAFGWSNITLFSLVVVVVAAYRKKSE